MLTDTGRARHKQVHCLDADSDELLAQLRFLNGLDIDLAADATRWRTGCVMRSPALERPLVSGWARPVWAPCW